MGWQFYQFQLCSRVGGCVRIGTALPCVGICVSVKAQLYSALNAFFPLDARGRARIYVVLRVRVGDPRVRSRMREGVCVRKGIFFEPGKP